MTCFHSGESRAKLSSDCPKEGLAADSCNRVDDEAHRSNTCNGPKLATESGRNDKNADGNNLILVRNRKEVAWAQVARQRHQTEPCNACVFACSFVGINRSAAGPAQQTSTLRTDGGET